MALKGFKGGRSKKGGANEREKSRNWSLWWTENERDDVFWRIQGSGGRATQRTKTGRETAAAYGDLRAEDPSGIPLISICVIELKKGYNKELDILSLIDGKGGKYTFFRFWEKVCSDADAAGKAGWGNEPMLILHRDYKLPVVVIRASFYNDIANYCGGIAENLFRISVNGETLYLFRLEDFFKNVTPEYFRWKYDQKNSR